MAPVYNNCCSLLLCAAFGLCEECQVYKGWAVWDRRHDSDVVNSFPKHIANVIGCDLDAGLVFVPVKSDVMSTVHGTMPSTCAADR